ncbi:MAG: hypothetical protein HZR80_09290 [Candidatus Heimdallarchaeota archaeon]
MRKIGVIGSLNPESTIEYYKIIVRTYNELKGGISFPKMIIDSLDLDKIGNYMSNNEWNKF